jgi:NAD(P)H dehydrogenase (quinone)
MKMALTSTNTAAAAKSVYVTVTKDVPLESQELWLSQYAHELATETWKESGCISYNIVRSNDVSDRFVIAEEWQSQGHLDAHFQTPHFQKLVPLMDAMSTTVSLDVSTNALTVSRESESESTSELNRKKRNGRILILYDSSTGSTEQMASLIAEGVVILDRMDVRIRVVPGDFTSWEDTSKPRDQLHPFATFDDIYWADGLAVGTPTNLGCVSYRMKKFWDDFSQAGGWGSTDGKIGTAFTSQGGNGGGGELACQAMQTVLLNFGFSTIGITDYIGFKETMHYGSVIAKKPREEYDKIKCRRQGSRLAEFVAYYINGRDDANPIHTKEWESKHWGFPGIPPKKAEIQELSQRSLQRGTPTSQDNNSTKKRKRALIFTKMMDYVHDSTPAMAAWVLCQVQELGWEGVVTDDSNFLESPSDLESFDLVVFLNNSGDIFQETKGLMAHIAAGKGIVGVHAAVAAFLNGKDASGETIMEPTSDIFESIFGSHFQNHPPVQTGSVMIDHKNAGSTLAPLLSSLPATFSHTDEFFNFTKNVCDDPEITVLAYVDESSYEGGLMGEKHPVVWFREMGEKKAPIYYCALGHFSHFYNKTSGSPHVASLLEAGLRFCAGC